MNPHKILWEKHWKHLGTTKFFFNRIIKFYRSQIISRAVRYYLEKYFPKQGFYIEAGCGTAGSSIRTKHLNRRIIGLDICFSPLIEASRNTCIDFFIQSNISKLPFKDNSFDGLWNLGVMEHFTEGEIQEILFEFHRVTKPNNYIILFWPPEYGATVIFLGTIERMYHFLFGRKFTFFPNEQSRIRSINHIKRIIAQTPFSKFKYYFSWRDLFTYAVIILRKD